MYTIRSPRGILETYRIGEARAETAGHRVHSYQGTDPNKLRAAEYEVGRPADYLPKRLNRVAGAASAWQTNGKRCADQMLGPGRVKTAADVADAGLGNLCELTGHGRNFCRNKAHFFGGERG